MIRDTAREYFAPVTQLWQAIPQRRRTQGLRFLGWLLVGVTVSQYREPQQALILGFVIFVLWRLCDPGK